MGKRTAVVCSVLLAGVLTFGWLDAQGGDPDAGQEVYKTSCLMCHGEQGKGDGKAAKMLKDKPHDWSDATVLSAYTDDELVQFIKEGGAAVGKSKLMPGFGKKLEDQQIQDVLAFIKSLAE